MRPLPVLRRVLQNSRSAVRRVDPTHLVTVGGGSQRTPYAVGQVRTARPRKRRRTRPLTRPTSLPRTCPQPNAIPPSRLPLVVRLPRLTRPCWTGCTTHSRWLAVRWVQPRWVLTSSVAPAGAELYPGLVDPPQSEVPSAPSGRLCASTVTPGQSSDELRGCVSLESAAGSPRVSETGRPERDPGHS